MKTYNVCLTSQVTRTYKVRAKNEKHAEEVAFRRLKPPPLPWGTGDWEVYYVLEQNALVRFRVPIEEHVKEEYL